MPDGFSDACLWCVEPLVHVVVIDLIGVTCDLQLRVFESLSKDRRLEHGLED